MTVFLSRQPCHPCLAGRRACLRRNDIEEVVIPAWFWQGSRIMKLFYVYILASKRNGTLYIGVTQDLVRRVYEHKNHLVEGFTKKYNVCQLVYFEETIDVLSAITREKQLKRWKRQWKIRLVEQQNPSWQDLYDRLVG